MTPKVSNSSAEVLEEFFYQCFVSSAPTMFSYVVGRDWQILFVVVVTQHDEVVIKVTSSPPERCKWEDILLTACSSFEKIYTSKEGKPRRIYSIPRAFITFLSQQEFLFTVVASLLPTCNIVRTPTLKSIYLARVK